MHVETNQCPQGLSAGTSLALRASQPFSKGFICTNFMATLCNRLEMKKLRHREIK